MLSATELNEIASRCEGLQSIAHLYEELQIHRFNLTGTEMKQLFLWSIRELMKKGRLKFLGEGWVRDGTSTDTPLMFGDSLFGIDEVIVEGLRQPVDPSPDGVVNLIYSKWPSQVTPAFNVRDDGFDSLWFEKWTFIWYDKSGNPILF